MEHLKEQNLDELKQPLSLGAEIEMLALVMSLPSEMRCAYDVILQRSCPFAKDDLAQMSSSSLKRELVKV